MTQYFPFDLFRVEHFVAQKDHTAQAIVRLEPHCLKPPWPWGQWLYGRILEACGGLNGGELIECGVGKGGMAAFLGHYARRAGRTVYALDSFQGLPAPNPTFDNAYFRKGDYGVRPDRGPLLERFRLLLAKENLECVVKPVPGLFEKTLSQLPEKRFAFAHIDADLHQSVHQCLDYLWPRIINGGFLVIDDFFHHAQGPARAASQYFGQREERPTFHISFPYSVILIKGEQRPRHANRSLDGNLYSFDFLTNDSLLRRTINESKLRALADGQSRAAQNAKLLEETLASSAGQSSAVYDYWRSLEEYWDDMDADEPEDRPAMGI